MDSQKLYFWEQQKEEQKNAQPGMKDPMMEQVMHEEGLQQGLMEPMDQQIEQVMAPAMAQDQALDLAAKQKKVQVRTEVEQNMPQSHVSISGAMQKLQQREYNRGKDSDEMKLVKEKTGDHAAGRDRERLSDGFCHAPQKRTVGR